MDNRDINPKPKIDVDRYPLAGNDRDLCPKSGIDVDRYPIAGDDPNSEGKNRWEKAIISFTLLKAKTATAQILKHFDPDRPPVIVVYATKWAISADLP